MRSKTLISYQKGYCGQPADIEAMKPREARAYCLGVGHVAAGTLPLGSGAEVLAALSTRRRGEGGDGETAKGTATAATKVTKATGVAPNHTFSVGDVVRRVSANGFLTSNPNVFRDFPLGKEFIVSLTDSTDSTIKIDHRWVNPEDFVLVRRAAPEPQR